MHGIRPTTNHSVIDITLPRSCQLTQALDGAVRSGDVECMRDLLKKGADPELVEPCNIPISSQTDELLLAARKINRLLPHGMKTACPSPFETALRNYDLPRTRGILAAVLTKWLPNVNATGAAIAFWQTVTEKGLDAVLDTMLVLGDDKLASYRLGHDRLGSKTIMDALLTPNGLNGFLHSPLGAASMRQSGAASIQHRALRDYLKQFPYYSEKLDRKVVAKLNNQFGFKENENEKILCRYLAFAWLTKVRHANGKPNYDMLKNSDQLQESIPYKTKAEYEAFLTNASEVHMVVNEAWGRFAVERFKEMEGAMEKGDPPIKRMLILSGVHAMAVELKIKEKAGKKSYVQNFYDPNLTNVHKRVKFDGVHRTETYSLTHLLENSFTYRAYYGERETVSMAYVVPNEDNGTLTSPTVGRLGRCLSSSLGDISIDSSVLFHLLESGFDGELSQIENRLLDKIKQRPDQAVALLAAENIEEVPGLYMALQQGHANTVKIFVEIIIQSGLDIEQQADLLAAWDSDGVPGIFMALQEGNAHVVREFVEGVIRSQLSDEQKVALLAAEDPDGVPGLLMAFSQDRVDTVRAFVESISQSMLSNEQKLTLLAAKDPDGVPSLNVALQEGCVETVRAFVESVSRSRLSDEQKVELLAAKDKMGRPAILIEEGAHTPSFAATAFREAVKQWLTTEQQALLNAEISGNKRRRITA